MYNLAYFSGQLEYIRSENTCMCDACQFCFCILCQRSSHGRSPCQVLSVWVENSEILDIYKLKILNISFLIFFYFSTRLTANVKKLLEEYNHAIAKVTYFNMDKNKIIT